MNGIKSQYPLSNTNYSGFNHTIRINCTTINLTLCKFVFVVLTTISCQLQMPIFFSKYITIYYIYIKSKKDFLLQLKSFNSKNFLLIIEQFIPCFRILLLYVHISHFKVSKKKNEKCIERILTLKIYFSKKTVIKRIQFHFWA